MAGLLLASVAWSGRAVADEPLADADDGIPAVDVRVRDDNLIVGRVLVPVPAGQVRQRIADLYDEEVDRPRVLEVVRLDRGACEHVTRRTKGLFSTLEMQTLRCRTQDGYSERLIESEDFEAYENAWRVRQVPEGAAVQLHLRTVVNRSVPQKWVNAAGARSVRRSLSSLLTKLGFVVEVDIPEE